MIQKHFVFLDESWYDSGFGCDCCPGEWVESWTCISHEELNYSCCSEIDCIQTAISLFDSTVFSQDLEEEGIRQKANQLGLSFSFIGNE